MPLPFMDISVPMLVVIDTRAESASAVEASAERRAAMELMRAASRSAAPPAPSGPREGPPKPHAVTPVSAAATATGSVVRRAVVLFIRPTPVPWLWPSR
ncbi:hypothetical protein GCM10009564_25490 [Streptomyces thermogriseus]|uniref:Uncharacterized protein n=1 Tax=Streptomyces thermogriseus TaxID=75292 RepID=A0ABP4DJJ5_9ACTN